MAIEFVVTGHFSSDTLRKGKQFTVKLKSSEGHELKLHSDTSAVFEGYPKESVVTVEIKKEQTTLEQ